MSSASVSSVYLVLYVEKKFYYILFFTVYRAEPVGQALDLEDYHPSVLLHCWLGHLTCKIVSEMTYNVSSGTLNPTIPYYPCRVEAIAMTLSHVEGQSPNVIYVRPAV